MKYSRFTALNIPKCEHFTLLVCPLRFVTWGPPPPCEQALVLPLSLQSRRNLGWRVLNNFITNIMVAIFDFNGSGRLGRGKFIPRGRSTVKNKEMGGVRGVKITPARSHCYFARLRSPKNGVPD